MVANRLVASVLVPSVTLALATSNYEYGPDEYVTIANGISPDGKFAITAHGSGYLGYYDFHLYLTDAISGKKIGPLEEIVGTRDTGGDAFAAKWSTDSRQVTIIYRVGRPLKAATCRIERRRARSIKGPFDVKADDLLTYWQTYSSATMPSPRIFGTPVKHD
jgi:hypothetical protein